jgi:hypothetical protein
MKPVKFYGVDGVRVVQRNKKYFVQESWARDEAGGYAKNENGEWYMTPEWRDVNPEPFDTLDEALDGAPYLCEF